MPLDTLANVKVRLGVTTSADDTLLNLLLDAADARVQIHTGTNFAGGTFTEHFPGNTELLVLANFPVAAVTSVKVDPAGAFGADTVVPATSYAVHAERGVIQSKVGPFLAAGRRGLVNADVPTWTRSPRAVQVVYTMATGAVPADVKHAYALLVGHWYRQVKTQAAAGFQNLDRQTFGDVTVAYRLDQQPLPPEAERLLAPYRTPSL